MFEKFFRTKFFKAMVEQSFKLDPFIIVLIICSVLFIGGSSTEIGFQFFLTQAICLYFIIILLNKIVLNK